LNSFIEACVNARPDPESYHSRYLDGIMIRTFEESDVDELAEHAAIPLAHGHHVGERLAQVGTVGARSSGWTS
jgi:ornithine carbamoyltransferase